MVIAPFVSPAWLAEHRASVVLADVRLYLDGRSSREAYEAGHLAGAVFVDPHLLAAPASVADGRHPLPRAEDFAASMAALGIGDDSTVVAYDDAGGVMAARLVWMLRVAGVEAALLDGGLATGQATADPVDPLPPATFTAFAWPRDRVGDIEDAVSRGNIVLDARPAERYAGAADDLDARFGHIPGQRSLPVREHLAADGRLLDADTLRARFAAVGVAEPDLPVVSACGSGVTACHNLLVMEHLGLGRGLLYPGSWSQYAGTDRPLVTGPDPG